MNEKGPLDKTPEDTRRLLASHLRARGAERSRSDVDSSFFLSTLHLMFRQTSQDTLLNANPSAASVALLSRALNVGKGGLCPWRMIAGARRVMEGGRDGGASRSHFS